MFAKLPRFPYELRRVWSVRRSSAMVTPIALTERELTLVHLLLDVSEHIGQADGLARPELRFTGGWVRDKLLGLSSTDIDVGISTMTGYKFGTLMKKYMEQPEAHSKWLQEYLAQQKTDSKCILGALAKIEANPEKSKHLETVTTKILGFDVDLVNLRKETYVEDSRNPTMEFGSPKDDALRRDATVNALFYNLMTSEVEDFTGRGLQDMEMKIIRTPLSAYQTFKDDPLRILRCIRFASKLGYQIEAEAEQSMSDSGIKNALRAKISRERVGVEIGKMLKGPDPRMALSLIDRLGLYNTIFTDPRKAELSPIDTINWKRAYDGLQHIMALGGGYVNGVDSVAIIKSTLLRNKDDEHLAWLLCAFTPWAQIKTTVPEKSMSKAPVPFAATVAREGIKADNRVTKLIQGAVNNLHEIIASKNATVGEDVPTTSPLKRKFDATSREDFGMAIRRWGGHWRNYTMYAILVGLMEAEDVTARLSLLTDYATWLSRLRELDLLDAYALIPLVKGSQLSKALNTEAGPWMKAATDMAMEWQLRNPDATDPREGIAEIVKQKGKLGLT